MPEFGNLSPQRFVFSRQRLNTLCDDPQWIKRCVHLALQRAGLIRGGRSVYDRRFLVVLVCVPPF
jgi:hypothetical protein